MARVGHRDELLAGAKRCLYEKGYARTTARDIVEASNTNLASIGYHYGSKDALLNAALIDAMDEWGDELERLLALPGERPSDPIERFEQSWARVIELFGSHRALWLAQFEAAPVIDRVPEVRAFFASLQTRVHEALGRLMQGLGEDAGPQLVRAAGAFDQALMVGLMMQWLIDPATAPSARELAQALRVTAGLPPTADRPPAAASARS